MAILKFPYDKDPDSDLDYIMDWEEWLEGDIILSSTWLVPTDLTTTGDTFNNTVTTIWLKDGISGVTYTLTNTITTVSSRTVERDVKLKVKER